MADHNQVEPNKRPLTVTIVMLVALIILAGIGGFIWIRDNAGIQVELGEMVNTPENFTSAVPSKVGYPAPEIALFDLDDTLMSLNDYRGKVVLVNIWTFWCTACRLDLPVLQSYFEDHQDKNFVVIGIEAGDETEDIVYHAKLFKLTFPIWQDPYKSAPRAFEMSFLPSSYVIDRNGHIVLTWSGAISREVLEQYVTPLLEE